MAKMSPIVPVAAAGAALLLMSKKKRRPSPGGTSRFGVHVSSDCQTVVVKDKDLFLQYLIGATKELIDIDQSLTAIQLTDALFGDLAPGCSGFPEEPESGAVVELYSTIARTVTRILAYDPRVQVSSEDFIDKTTAIAYNDWYKAWRNYPSAVVPGVPDGQVSFSSDLSSYEISPTWYENTVKPFVHEAVQQGAGDTAYESFVDQRGVLVGELVEPIAGLPEGNSVVEKFLDELESAIEHAVAEVTA